MNRRVWCSILAVLGATAQICFGSSGTIGAEDTTLTPPPTKNTDAPPFDDVGVRRVFLIILENGSFKEATERNKTFLHFLVEHGTILNNYFAVAHPSQPNYIALISGSVADVPHGDAMVTLDRRHLGQALGDRWRVYAERYPAKRGGCNLAEADNVPLFGYVRRHVPFLSFRDVQTSGCHQIIAETEHATSVKRDMKNGTLPDFALFIPSLKHDGHAPSNMTIANRWLDRTFRKLLKDKRFTKDLVFIVTFDENDDHSQPNKVFTVLWGDHVKNGVSSDVYDHYDLLATIAALLKVTAPPLPSGSRPIGGIWKK